METIYSYFKKNKKIVICISIIIILIIFLISRSLDSTKNTVSTENKIEEKSSEVVETEEPEELVEKQYVDIKGAVVNPGVYEIFDYYTAIEEGKIPEGYDIGWWGFEDKKLFEYAKEKITKLSEENHPFNVTILTVDTHHTGGYLDSSCKEIYNKDYANAIACSDQKVYEFVEWVKKQEFYKNTTIVITGDHLSMDTQFFKDLNKEYNRTIFNVFINSAVDTTNNKNRSFSVLDMYPTTLAAMGVVLDGDRIGLGTNLFSNLETLLEKQPNFDNELSQKSNFYNNKIIYGLK